MNESTTSELTSWQRDLLQLFENGSTQGSLDVLNSLTTQDWRAMEEPVWAWLIMAGEDVLFQHALEAMKAHQAVSARLLDWMMLNRPLRSGWLDTLAQQVAPGVNSDEDRRLCSKAIGGLMIQKEWEIAGRLAEHLRHRLSVSQVEELLNTLRSCPQAPPAFVHQLMGPSPLHKPQVWNVVKRVIEKKEWELAVALLTYSDDTVREIYLPHLLTPDTIKAVAPLVERSPELTSNLYGQLQAKVWDTQRQDTARQAADQLDQLASLETLETQRRWCTLNPGQLPLSEQRVLAADRADQARSQGPGASSRPRQRC